MNAGTPPPARSRRAWAIAYAAAGAAAVAAYFAAPGGVQPWMFPLIQYTAAAAVVAGVVLHRPERRLPWFLLAGAVAGLASGDVLMELTGDDVVPSGAYLLAYGLLVAGSVLLVRPRAHGSALIDAGIVAASVGTLQAIVVIVPELSDTTHGELLGHGLALAYPTLDLLLLLVLIQFGTAGWRSASYGLVLVAVALLFVGDEWYAISYETYEQGGGANGLWMLSSVLIGVAALHGSMRDLPTSAARLAPRVVQLRVGLLGVAVLLPPALSLVAAITSDRGLGRSLDFVSLGLALLVFARMVQLFRDLDQARRAERLSRAEAEAARAGVLAQNHRLREVDRIKDGVLASISHEFRSPLTSIRGHLRLVVDQAGERLDDRHRRSLDVIDRSSNRLMRHIEDLLLVAQLRGGGLELEVEHVNVGRVASECVEATRPSALAKDIEIDLVVSEQAAVLGEGARLAQVVDNLLSNAIKFSHPGGRVGVKVVEGIGDVTIEVSDSGVGIPEHERVRLFEPFNRGQAAATRHTQGTGLGLFIAHAMVEAHGGRIAVDSRPGSGTVMRVSIPTNGRGPENAALFQMSQTA